MKLATYNDGSRDGQLMVVSRDLTQAVFASHLVNRLQSVLDDWNYLAPQLQDVSDSLNAGRARHAFAFDPTQCMAPLPRAHQWVQAQAYVNHLTLVGQAGGVPLAADVRQRAVFACSGADNLCGASDAMLCAEPHDGIDFAAQLAVVTADVPMGASAERGLDSVRLLMLANSMYVRCESGVSLQPATAFSPVAVTLDELGPAWSKGRVNRPLLCSWNGRKVGQCEAGADMHFHFGQLIAQLATHRRLGAGSIVGSGPVSNQGVERKGQPVWPQGYSSIAEKRAMETIQDGAPRTGYLQHGDTVQVEMKDASGASIFGSIVQTVRVLSCESAAAQTS